jgi:hypothetical protein
MRATVSLFIPRPTIVVRFSKPYQTTIEPMNTNQKDRLIQGISMLIAQSLTIISSFMWMEDGRYSVNCSVLIVLSSFFWIVGLMGLFDLFKEKNPWYARLGLIYALYGCVGGIAFGFEGLYSVLFGMSEKIGVEAYAQYPMQMNLVLFWAGPAFPLSFLAFGIMFGVRKIGPWWIALLLSLGGISFPVSRILRIEWVAHVSDLLLFIPVCIISLAFIRGTGIHNKQDAQL